MMTQLRELWSRPGLGVQMIGAGIFLLVIGLMLNRIFPDPITVRADDLELAIAVRIYTILHWAMWAIGGALTLVGAARIFSMMDG
jgi:hypothetical protein